MEIVHRPQSARRAVIVDGVRSPFTPPGGPLGDVLAVDLVRTIITELLARADFDPAGLDEIILGTSHGPPGSAAALGRGVAAAAGLTRAIPGLAVHRGAASGMEAIAQAHHRVAAGEALAVVASGAESGLDVAPRGVPRRLGVLGRRASRRRLEHVSSPLTAPGSLEGGERLARTFRIGREAQDAFALLSHQRACAAAAAGRLAEEIAAVYLPPEYSAFVVEDSCPRGGLTPEALASAAPAFDPRYGTVTLENSSPGADGACALLVMEEERARAEGYRALGRMRAFALSGLEPRRAGLGPVFAAARVLASAGIRLSEVDLVEMDEASAAQVIANEIAFASSDFARDELKRDAPLGGLDRARLNVNGGAIALGCPLGATGARIILTLLKEMRRRQAALGLAAVAVSGGQGAAMLLEAA